MSKPVLNVFFYRVRLRGGYDSIGSYFGVGAPLYAYSIDEDNIGTRHERAMSAAQAKSQIRDRFPNYTLSFYR